MKSLIVTSSNFFISISSISAILSYISLSLYLIMHINTCYIHMNSFILVYPCMHISMRAHAQFIHANIYTSTHTNINMDKYIYEMTRYSTYCSNSHPNNIHTYRLTYCFPLHLFSKILLLAFTELSNIVGLVSFFGTSFHCLKA